MLKIGHPVWQTGAQIVGDHNLRTTFYKESCNVRTYISSTAGYENCHGSKNRQTKGLEGLIQTLKVLSKLDLAPVHLNRITSV
jgi:hypothetical protein